jgi:hypothetical protein
MLLDGSSALLDQWTDQVRAQWAAHRAGAAEDGGDGGAWLDGDAAEAIICDAGVAPVVTGEVNMDALEDLVRLCVELGRHRRGVGGRGSDGRNGSGGDSTGSRSGGAGPGASPGWEALEQAIIGKTMILLLHS